MSCEVDYARGGGSSGAMVRDAGAVSASTRTAGGRVSGASSVRMSTTKKPAAHEAKSWQSFDEGER
jgi:hypothetical protein